MRAATDLLMRRRDALLAGALLVFGLAELALHESYQGRPAWPGPPTASVVEACLLTVPLAWRRSRATWSSLVVLGTVAVWSPLFGAVEATAGFLALLVSVFSGTAYARRPAVVLGAAALALTLHNLVDPSVRTAIDWFWSTGFLAVAVLLGGAVRTRQLRIVSLEQDADVRAREYEEQVATATAAERSAISRELHDIVAHAVSVIVVQAQAGSRSLDDDPETTRMLLSTIETTGRSALEDLRRLLRLLSDEATVEPAPGLASLPGLVQGFRDAGVAVDLALPHQLPRMSGAADLAAYRLVQESLTNSVRHAPGASVRVRVTVEGMHVEVLVEDDGGGPVRDKPSIEGTGRGLIGMRERVTLAGGTLVATGSTGHGFRVQARLPIEEPCAEALTMPTGTRH